MYNLIVSNRIARNLIIMTDAAQQTMRHRFITRKDRYIMVHTFTTENFEAEVLNSSVPVFVDFYADWCGPCKMMSPVIDKLAEEFDGRIKVGKINVDDNPEVAMKYNIMSIPNMKFFKGGAIVDEVIGAIPKAAMKTKFEQNV